MRDNKTYAHVGVYPPPPNPYGAMLPDSTLPDQPVCHDYGQQFDYEREQDRGIWIIAAVLTIIAIGAVYFLLG